MSEAEIISQESAEPEEINLDDQPPEDEAPPEEQAEEEGEEQPEEKAQRMDWERVARDRERAMHAERRARQLVESRIQQIEDHARRMEEQFRARQQEPARPKVKPTDDPIAYLEQLEQEREEREQREAQQAQQRQLQEQQRQAFMQEFNKTKQEVDYYEAEFSQDHPDYYEVVNPYLQNRYRDYQDLGYQSHADIMEQLQIEAFQLAKRTSVAGISPAEAIYKMAKRAGFGAKKAANQSFDKLEKGQGAQRRLSEGGKRQPGPKTYTDIARIKSDDEFLAALRAKESIG